MATSDPLTVVETITLPLAPREAAELEQEKAVILGIALPARLDTHEQFAEVDAFQSRLRTFVAKAKAPFDEVVGQAYKAHTAACKLRNLFFGSLETTDKRCGELLSDYNRRDREERRRKELQEQEERQKEERARLDKEAKLAKRQGDHDRAEALKNTPVSAPVVTQRSTLPPTEASFRKEWKGRPAAGTIDDATALKAAAQLLPRAYLTPDLPALRAAATDFKGTVKLPGWEFYEEDVTVRPRR